MRPCEDLSFIRASRLSTASDHGSWGEKYCGKWAALRIAHKRIIRWTRIRRIQPPEGRTRYRLAFHRGQFLRRPRGFSRHWRETASGLVKETPALGRTRPGPWPVGWHAHAPQRLFGYSNSPHFIKTEGPLVRTTASHVSTLSQINPLYALPSQSILMCYYHLLLGLQSYLLTSGFPAKTPSVFVFSLPRPSHSS